MRRIAGPTLSIIVITWNEERNICRCLDSLRFSPSVLRREDVVVVDAESQDNTATLAHQWGASVFVRAWPGYGAQRNWALERCTSDWILMLDADEELTPALIAEIETTLSRAEADVDGYHIKGRTFFLGKWIRHCGWWPGFHLRLIRRGSGECTEMPIHEGLAVTGRTVKLNEAMNHYSYNSLEQFLEKSNRYTTLSMLAIPLEKRKLWKYHLLAAPFQEFFRMYIRRMGFLEGWHGLVLCTLTAAGAFCAYAKLWEKEILPREQASDSDQH